MDVAVVPLNVTVLAPCAPPKLEPAIVTPEPGGPLFGVRLAMAGEGFTVNATPLLSPAPVVTTTFPVVAPTGTVATIDVLPQLLTAAATPLNFTVLLPCVAPKLEPAIDTAAPTGPLFGVRLEMDGGVVTVNATPLLAPAPVVTTTFPVVAPTGTVATIDVLFQLVTAAAIPLNFTVLVPCVAPKLEPAIDTADPTGPLFGVRLAMDGAAVTVNSRPLLSPATVVTTTFPVVAPAGTVATIDVLLQLLTAAPIPLNFTVLVPCVAPKFDPAIVTAAPTGPELGVKVESTGVEITVNGKPLLDPATVVTTTFPVVAPTGTVVTIDVLLQLLTAATIPLNFTALAPCVAPRLVPAIVTVEPTSPEFGLSVESAGAPITVNGKPLLGPPAVVVTTTFPVPAPAGTTATMDVEVQVTMVVAAAPLKVTVLLPWLAPKFVPAIVTEDPTAPLFGVRLVIVGDGFTVNATPLLNPAAVLTTTLPEVAPPGTTANIEPELQLLMTAAIPLKVTVLLPCVAPKFDPLIVIVDPTPP
jgi:hypothetical protein